MKFCTNCGNELRDGVKFCTKCGTPVKEQPAPEPEAQPEHAAAQPEQAAVQPEQKPAAPKKPLNLKPIIIFGSIGLVLIVGIIVFFTVFFPELTAKHVKLTDYVKASFFSESYVDGHISCNIGFDSEAAYNAVVADDKKQSVPYYRFDSYFNSFYKSYENLSAADTIKEPFNVIDDERTIGELERMIGVRFDKEQNIEIKLSDEIKSKKLEILTPVEIDFFKYIDDNYYNVGVIKDEVKVKVKSGEFDSGDYKVKLSGFDDEYSSSGTFSVTKDGKEVATVYAKSDDYNYSDGGKAVISLSYYEDSNDSKMIYGTPVIVKETEKEYKVTAQKAADKAVVKKRLSELRKATVKEHKSTGYTTTVNETYLLTAKEADSDYVNIIVNVYTQSSKKYKYKYVYLDMFRNAYEDEYSKNEFKYYQSGSWSSYKSVKEAVKDMKTDYADDYKIEKIK